MSVDPGTQFTGLLADGVLTGRRQTIRNAFDDRIALGRRSRGYFSGVGDALRAQCRDETVSSLAASRSREACPPRASTVRPGIA